MDKSEQSIRLSPKTIATLKSLFVQYFLPNDSLWIFGSRVDPNRRGGDIDLYIETHMMDTDMVVKRQLAFESALQMALGEQKIDVVMCLLKSDYQLPIYEVAKAEGIKLV